MSRVVGFVFLLAVSSVFAGDGLLDGWRTPPKEARPHTWWHWMNGNVSKKGITADLEAMAAAGLGGVQVFDAGLPLPEGPVRFASEAWYDHIAFAAHEAERLGLSFGVANCSGWTSSGGPWITPEHKAPVFHQQLQQHELLECKGHRLPVHFHLVPVRTDVQGAEAVFRRRRTALRTAKHRADPGDQFHHAEWLGDEIVCPCVQTLHAVVFGVFCGEHDNGKSRCGRGGTETPQDRDAVLAGKHDVQDREPGNLLLQRFPEMLRRIETESVIALALQSIYHQLADAVVIFQQIDHSFHLFSYRNTDRGL